MRADTHTVTVCLVMLAFHDADTDTETDTESPNTLTVLRTTHAISSRGLAAYSRRGLAYFVEYLQMYWTDFRSLFTELKHFWCR